MQEPVALNDEAERILTVAQTIAPVAVSGPHILLAILADRECGAARLLSEYGINITRLQKGAEWVATTSRYSDDAPDGFSTEADYLITQALAHARLYRHPEAGTEHLLYAIATEPLSGASELLGALGFNRTIAMLGLASSYHPERPARVPVEVRPDGSVPPPRAAGLSDLAAAGVLEDDAAEFIEASVRAACSVAIVGPTGIGKTTMLGALCNVLTAADRPLVVFSGNEEFAFPDSPSPITHVATDLDADDAQGPGLLDAAQVVLAGANGSHVAVDNPGRAALALIKASAEHDAIPSVLWTMHASDDAAVARHMRLVDDESDGFGRTAAVIVKMSRQGHHRVVESISEVDSDDDTMTIPLWDRRSGRLAFTGTPTQRSARIREDGWIVNERPWLAA